MEMSISDFFRAWILLITLVWNRGQILVFIFFGSFRGWPKWRAEQLSTVSEVQTLTKHKKREIPKLIQSTRINSDEQRSTTDEGKEEDAK